MPQDQIADAELLDDVAAERLGQGRVVIAGDPDPLAPGLHRSQRVGVPAVEPVRPADVVKAVAEGHHPARMITADHAP
jgi:hypothetical protein